MGEAKDYRDESLTDQERVENLLEQMSLEEKVSQPQGSKKKTLSIAYWWLIHTILFCVSQVVVACTG